MSPCPDIEAIERLCAGTAAAAEQTAWTAHATTCAACRSLADEVRANLDAWARWRPLAVPPAPPRPPEVPGVVVGELLSSGGQGVVWRGVQTATDRAVAVKVIRSHADAAARARFAREARLGASLRHPQLVTVLDAGATAAGELYLVMEYVAGETLEAARRRGPPPLDAAWRCCAAIAAAVRFAHQHGVLHRDLKPSNILVTADGDVRVLDFGLAKALDAVAPDAHATLDGAFVGTLACAAPEQLRCDGAPLDVRTDLFQLGVVFYRYLTGEWPHAPESDPRAMLGKRLHDAPTRPSRLRPDLPHDTDTVLLRLLAPAADQRYATANELCEDLDRLQRGAPIAARAEEIRARLARLAGRYRATMLAAAAVAVVLAVATWLVLGYARRADADRRTIANEYARAEELLGILTDALDGLAAGAAGPRTPMVDFLDGIVAELEQRPAVDPAGRADLLMRAAEVYARLVDPVRAAGFVARARVLLGSGADSPVPSDAALLLHAEELRLRLAAAVPEPGLDRELAPVLAALEPRFGPGAVPLLRLRVLEQVALRGGADPQAAAAALRDIGARVDAMPAGADREALVELCDYAAVAIASAVGDGREALERGRALLARSFGVDHSARLRRFAVLQLVSQTALDHGDLALADATSAECVELAAGVALPDDPRGAQARFVRGLCLTRLGRSEAALPEFRAFMDRVDAGVAASPRMVALASVLLAGASAAAGGIDDALARLGRARDALAALGAASAADLLQVECALAEVLAGAARTAEARGVLERALSRSIELDGGVRSDRTGAIEAMLAELAGR